MAEVVLADSQWTMVRYLRPFPNFERVYQGADGSRTIAFPGVLDHYALRGDQGYDPNLIAGLTVPFGARITVWIPVTLAPGDESGPVVNALYQYQIIWRWRTPRDYRVGQSEGQASAVQSYSSYHVPTSGFGQPQVVTSPALPSDQRYFLPGSQRTVAFEQTEPGDGTPSVIHLRGEYLQPVADPIWQPPLTPKGELAVWQQGSYVDSASANAGGPAYLTFTTDVEGDEMCILASKIDTSSPWDFTTESPGDLAFSNTYGNANGQNPPNQYGILVTTGTP